LRVSLPNFPGSKKKRGGGGVAPLELINVFVILNSLVGGKRRKKHIFLSILFLKQQEEGKGKRGGTARCCAVRAPPIL